MSNVAEVIDVPLKKDLMAKFESRLMAPPSDVEDASTSTVKKPQTTGESRIDKQDNVLDSQEALQASMVNLPPHARPFSEPNNDTVHLDEIDHTPSPAALFYSFLLQTKLAPNTTVELQWLLSLLVQKKRDAEATYAKQFALSVLNTIPSWLEAYGVDVLKLVIETFQKALVATPLTDRFVQYLEQYEGDRATESQLAGAPLPIESEAIPSTHRNFALPFREDTDSRLHFRTPQESIIFTNREKARDGFLALLRSWQNARSAIRRQEDQIVRQSASAVLDDLVVENHWWFAQLFVMELLQVAVNPVGEYDHDLVLKIIHDDKQLKNADRLRKLHQRFTHVQSSKQTNLTLEKPGPLDASGHDPAVDDPSAFSDNQRFFYDFLVATNHFQFSSLVAMVLQANLSQTLATFPNTSSITTMRKQFSVKVLQAKLLGKFLGWLHYAPCWASPWPSKHNAAMEAATRDAINMRNHVQAPLDVASYLEMAITDHTLMAHIPWVCDYMVMVSKDPIACDTLYFQNVIAKLHQIYCSRRLNQLPRENAWFLSLQLEALLKGKHQHLMFARLQHSTTALDDQTLSVLDEPCQGMDATTFLVNNLFVQCCVQDVPTFRRFLQAIHQDDKHATSRKVKLRPLVIQEPSLLAPSSDSPPPNTISTTKTASPKQRVESALTIAFYKQYPSVQPTIEFVVDTTMTNVCHFANTTLLQPAAAAFVERLFAKVDPSLPKDDQTTWMTAQVRLHLPAAKTQACRQAREASQPFCKHHIPLAMQSLLSPTLPNCVKTIAIDLATERAVASLETLVETSLAMEFSKHIVARMRKLKKETPPPVPASTVSTSLDGLYALSKLILDTPGDKTSHVHAFADLATWLTVSPIVLCCLFDTVPHIPLEDPSISFDIVRILRHILKTPQTLKEVNDFATSLVTSTVSASLKRDKPEAAVQFIKLVCDEWPSLGGSIQAILVEHVSTSTGIIQQLFLHSRVMFASAMASAHVVGCVDHLIPQ
ncbi:hypothetical protein H310_14901 [Aphanomyces invadans]|uniref:Codanin-1 C-terminal domain-containing protein n=1 Tax=Aphanomyces invadans TaxID=157072 RepID=A0A024T879_9STRA|nr:hypothetical protein H310_14901 [Aphanomyces invadans]ETV90280.1 hypothetical protein H310_14901 [Aphanomyces invadans]|eukprot:XP_008881087.1 hypothetical protein H310_14901 [Aphanomyces invadans]